MSKALKTAQLQIRLSGQQKAAVTREAKRAGLTLSAWILRRLLTEGKDYFQQMMESLSTTDHPGMVLAELNDWLTGLSKVELKRVAESPPVLPTDMYRANYLAAMLEQACALKEMEPPPWLRNIKPLDKPQFVTDIKSVRLHLLRHSPPSFRNRNIFIDASLGARV